MTVDTQLAAPDILRDEAISRCAAHNRFAVESAYFDIIRRTSGAFTSDDVWASIAHELAAMAPNAEPRAIGAAFKRASDRGFIKSTGRWVKSKMAMCHGREKREWTPTVSIP